MKLILVFQAIVLLLTLTFIGAVTYVAWHFIEKFW